MKTAVVCTSIFDVKFLNGFVKNFERYGCNEDEITFLIVGDNKTNSEQYSRFVSNYSYMRYFDPAFQDSYLSNLGSGVQEILFPENSPRRRNFGYLIANAEGFDNIIVVDDDNIPSEISNFYKQHIDALTVSSKKPIVRSRNGFVNPCRLGYANKKICYARGYPIDLYFTDTFELSDSNVEFSSMLNLGLWDVFPDVDAMLNLLQGEINSTIPKISVFLSSNCLMTINTQNTGYRKEIMPIFWNYYTPEILDAKTDRYDDIWNGWVVNKVINTIGGKISFGIPVSNHMRNVHNFVDDFKKEYIGAIINIALCKEIKSMVLESKDPISCYLEIADHLIAYDNFSEPTISKCIAKIGESMRLWMDVMERLCGV